MSIKTQKVWGELCLLIAVVAPDVTPEQRFSALGLGTGEEGGGIQKHSSEKQRERKHPAASLGADGRWR